jgi:PD-(D/E)XK endonuclease
VHPRTQGDLGEASAIEWLTRQGAVVCKPLFHSPHFDLVAEMAGRLVRIEVKTTIRPTPAGNWHAMICTRGGNQSWSGTTKRFDPQKCDFVFVVTGDGRRWFIPATRIEASTAIVLGCRKYAEFEIEPTGPLPARTPPKAASTIASP